ncbi:hypothetical protein OF001_U220031 [Pseudomonas sp. OF001]|nr:hypothetical protein OF001_U220031 [Pseudomonas sp. OF001]
MVSIASNSFNVLDFINDEQVNFIEMIGFVEP